MNGLCLTCCRISAKTLDKVYCEHQKQFGKLEISCEKYVEVTEENDPFDHTKKFLRGLIDADS
jgi:hypothetical protein